MEINNRYLVELPRVFRIIIIEASTSSAQVQPLTWATVLPAAICNATRHRLHPRSLLANIVQVVDLDLACNPCYPDPYDDDIAEYIISWAMEFKPAIPNPAF